MPQYHDVMMVKGYEKVKKYDQHEVNASDLVMMYEQQAEMEEWIWEDEMMRGYSAQDD